MYSFFLAEEHFNLPFLYLLGDCVYSDGIFDTPIKGNTIFSCRQRIKYQPSGIIGWDPYVFTCLIDERKFNPDIDDVKLLVRMMSRRHTIFIQDGDEFMINVNSNKALEYAREMVS
jgi:hypothetical protein